MFFSLKLQKSIKKWFLNQSRVFFNASKWISWKKTFFQIFSFFDQKTKIGCNSLSTFAIIQIWIQKIKGLLMTQNDYQQFFDISNLSCSKIILKHQFVHICVEPSISGKSGPRRRVLRTIELSVERKKSFHRCSESASHHAGWKAGYHRSRILV